MNDNSGEFPGEHRLPEEEEEEEQLPLRVPNKGRGGCPWKQAKKPVPAPSPIPEDTQLYGRREAGQQALEVSNRCLSCGEWGHFLVNCPLPEEEKEPLPEGSWNACLRILEVSSWCPACGEREHFLVNCPLQEEEEQLPEYPALMSPLSMPVPPLPLCAAPVPVGGLHAEVSIAVASIVTASSTPSGGSSGAAIAGVPSPASPMWQCGRESPAGAWVYVLV
ncbi:UNVERIFIED_CONTAM: hypothetical protein FKN15_058738 [Acipenser sinensis]